MNIKIKSNNLHINNNIDNNTNMAMNLKEITIYLAINLKFQKNKDKILVENNLINCLEKMHRV